jgi:hypothetical protein
MYATVVNDVIRYYLQRETAAPHVYGTKQYV